MKKKNDFSGQTEQHMMTCTSCGGVFAADLPACPYCGALNYGSAEDAYMDKLDDIRGDMDDLKSMTRQHTKQELKRQSRILIRLAIAALILIVVCLCGVRIAKNREAAADREEYLWRTETFPKLDALYEAGDLEGMAELYEQESGKGMPVWSYAHSELCRAVAEMNQLEYYFDREASGETMETYDLQEIMYFEQDLISMQWRQDIPKEDREYIFGLAEIGRADMISRFSLTDEETEALETELKKNRYPDYDGIKKFVKSRQ